MCGECVQVGVVNDQLEMSTKTGKGSLLGVTLAKIRGCSADKV